MVSLGTLLEYDFLLCLSVKGVNQYTLKQVRNQHCWQLSDDVPSWLSTTLTEQKRCLNKATPWSHLGDRAKATPQLQKWWNIPLFCLTGVTAAPWPYQEEHPSHGGPPIWLINTANTHNHKTAPASWNIQCGAGLHLLKQTRTHPHSPRSFSQLLMVPHDFSLPTAIKIHPISFYYSRCIPDDLSLVGFNTE